MASIISNNLQSLDNKAINDISEIDYIGLVIFDSEPWWTMFFLGFTFIFLGLALFGVICLRKRLLSKWNAVPFLTGIWISADHILPDKLC
jgi:hypothetical protein